LQIAYNICSKYRRKLLWERQKYFKEESRTDSKKRSYKQMSEWNCVFDVCARNRGLCPHRKTATISCCSKSL